MSRQCQKKGNEINMVLEEATITIEDSTIKNGSPKNLVAVWIDNKLTLTAMSQSYTKKPIKKYKLRHRPQITWVKKN